MAFRATPGRTGRLVQLDADEILVAGDLHGHLGNFQQVLKLANLDANPRRHLVFQEVVHGKFFYPGGGEKSHQLLDLIAVLKCKYPERIHLLPGNHELSQITNRPIQKGDDDLNEIFDRGVEMAYPVHHEEILSAYRELLHAVPLALRTSNRIFISHSLPSTRRMDDFRLEALLEDRTDEKELLPGGSVFAMVWGRDTSQENVEAYLQKVDADFLISGHIPTEEGYEVPNGRQLILDCMDHPAACCLVSASESISHDDLVSGIRILQGA